MNVVIHTRFTLMLLFIMSFSSTSICAQDQKGVQSILDKHAQAIGYNERQKVHTLISIGQIEQMGSTLDVTIIQKRPNKYRMDIHFQDGRITQTYNGQSGWSLNPFVSADTLEIKGMELDQLIESALFDGLLFNADSLGYKLSYLGEENIITDPSYVILLKKPNGDRLKFYIGKLDYFIRRTEATLFVEGMSYEVNSTFSGFKKVNGLMLPHTIENNNGQLATKMHIKTVRINEMIEDKLFNWR